MNRVLDFESGKFRAPEFESLAQLQDQVAGALMQLLIERFHLTVTRPPFLAPRRLEVFVGRDAYIEALTRQLIAGETALIHGLYGIGGLGKTALALELAYRLREHFDGGVLWAELPTTNPHNTLADWARAYGGDLSRIEDTNTRADALRAILRGRRVLAILDGAVDEADDAKIAPLLRALADCPVIVTSRVTQLNSLAHARRLDLDKMNDDEAVALFDRIVGAIHQSSLPRDKILAIAKIVDYLPLALDLAAAQLREHPSWTLDDVLTMLRDERTRLDTLQWGDGRTRGIRASIQMSYKRLTDEEQKFFAALGVFAGDDFDVRAAAFVAMETCPEQGRRDEGRTTEDEGRRTEDEGRKTEDERRKTEDERRRMRDERWAWAMLERLRRLSLVQEGRRAMRYRLHPLLRDYAIENCQLTIDNCQLTIDNYQRRMAQYYLAVARDADEKLKGAQGAVARQTLDDELGNIRGAVAWARANPQPTTWKFLRDIAFAMSHYLDLRGYWDEWREWLEYAHAACQKLGDVRSEAATINNLGNVYLRKGDWDKAVELYQKSLSIKEKIGDVLGMAQTYGNLGSVYVRKGDWDKAVELYQQSLRIKEKIGDVHGMAQTYGNLGYLYEAQGDFERALEYAEKALAIFKQLGAYEAAQVEELVARSRRKLKSLIT